MPTFFLCENHLISWTKIADSSSPLPAFRFANGYGRPLRLCRPANAVVTLAILAPSGLVGFD